MTEQVWLLDFFLVKGGPAVGFYPAPKTVSTSDTAAVQEVQEIYVKVGLLPDDRGQVKQPQWSQPEITCGEIIYPGIDEKDAFFMRHK
jgi:hypothetical protein